MTSRPISAGNPERAPLCTRIGHVFFRPELLEEALTHRSAGAPNNERLEFLGDAALNFVVGLELYRRFPHLSEGELSRLRAGLVNRDALCEIARGAGLGPCLRMGEGESRSGGVERPSILADALEAIVGAVFLDAGWEAAEAVVVRLFEPMLAGLDGTRVTKDPKTALQEQLQARRLPLPNYQVVATWGEAHEQQFHVACEVQALGLRSEGRGASRRAAEQGAARAMQSLLEGAQGAASA